MANQLGSDPVVIDTDLNSFNAAQTLNPATGDGVQGGLRVRKMALVVGGSAAVAGTVTVTDPVSGINLLAPMQVVNGAANTILFDDDFIRPLVWSDFKVTGVTATGTKLYIWYV